MSERGNDTVPQWESASTPLLGALISVYLANDTTEPSFAQATAATDHCPGLLP